MFAFLPNFLKVSKEHKGTNFLFLNFHSQKFKMGNSKFLQHILVFCACLRNSDWSKVHVDDFHHVGGAFRRSWLQAHQSYCSQVLVLTRKSWLVEQFGASISPAISGASGASPLHQRRQHWYATSTGKLRTIVLCESERNTSDLQESVHSLSNTRSLGLFRQVVEMWKCVLCGNEE